MSAKEKEVPGYTVVDPVLHDGVMYEIGEEITTLTSKQAELLLEKGSINAT